jgi:hypothetical protein
VRFPRLIRSSPSLVRGEQTFRVHLPLEPSQEGVTGRLSVSSRVDPRMQGMSSDTSAKRSLLRGKGDPSGHAEVAFRPPAPKRVLRGAPPLDSQL